MDNLCVGACTSDDQCASTDRPFCEAGVCIECRSSLNCPASAAICDQTDHTCRGCRADDECGSGVCIEADAVCATAEQLIHVKQFGTDTGTCTAAAPCETIGFAMQQVTAARNVIRVTGGSLTGETVTIDRSVILDGTGTRLTKPFNTSPQFQVTAGAATIEGFTIVGHATMLDVPAITVSNSSLRITSTTTNDAPIIGTNATVQLDDVEVLTSSIYDQVMVKCSTGTLSVTTTEFMRTALESTNCQLTVERSLFDGVSDRSIASSGGKVIIENNLIVESYELADSMSVVASAPGSAIRFNTFVNTSGVDSDGVALFCDGTQDVSNNVFAYRSAHPMGAPGGTPCPTKFSLFDAIAVPEQRTGEGNRRADFALIFANAGAKDFHLAESSEAKGGAQPNILSIDHEGSPRPRPVGSNPDMGCFEAP